jgi:Sin3 binding region of histone deacetylase complex subunit SAP30
VRPEAPPSELAVAVARHFEGMEVDEEECIGGFLERLENPSGLTEYARKSGYFDGRAPQPSVRKRKRTKLAARPGEQVRTKVPRSA